MDYVVNIPCDGFTDNKPDHLFEITKEGEVVFNYSSAFIEAHLKTNMERTIFRLAMNYANLKTKLEILKAE